MRLNRCRFRKNVASSFNRLHPRKIERRFCIIQITLIDFQRRRRCAQTSPAGGAGRRGFRLAKNLGKPSLGFFITAPWHNRPARQIDLSDARDMFKTNPWLINELRPVSSGAVGEIRVGESHQKYPIHFLAQRSVDLGDARRHHSLEPSGAGRCR